MEEIVMEEAAPYLAPSNEAISLQLQRVDPKSGKRGNAFEEPFHPSFTYSIFGEEETIFGYQDLSISINFQAHDMLPSLGFKYSKVYQPIGETKAMDLKEMLKDFLPDYAIEHATENLEENGTTIPTVDFNDWTPPGELIDSYTRNGKRFEIWCASLADAKAKELLRRSQILIPLFIEGGTCQNLDNEPWTMERWKLFLLYQKDEKPSSPAASPYTFAGLATSYRLWVGLYPRVEVDPTNSEDLPSGAALEDDGGSFEDSDPIDTDESTGTLKVTHNPLNSRSRERISQFVILPPFQGQSHGAHLYNSMYERFKSDPAVFEIVVEDPNESFDDLRDWCDLAYLRNNLPQFNALQIADRVDDALLQPTSFVPVDHLLPSSGTEHLRKEAKIGTRQFARLTEMHLLSKIPSLNRNPKRISRKAKAADENDRRFYFWRLLVKERIFRQHLGQLAQVDAEERVEKVEATLPGIQEEYERILKGAERRMKLADANGNVQSESDKKRKLADRKKKVFVIEDDDDDDDDEDESTTIETEPKRPRIQTDAEIAAAAERYVAGGGIAVDARRQAKLWEKAGGNRVAFAEAVLDFEAKLNGDFEQRATDTLADMMREFTNP